MLDVQKAATSAAAVAKEPTTPSRRKSSDIKSSDTEVILASESTESVSAGSKKLVGSMKKFEERKKAIANLMNIKENDDF